MIVSPSQGGANRSGKRVQGELHAPWRVPGAPARGAARGRGRSARARRPPPTRPARRRSTRAPRAAPRCEARTPFRTRPPVCGLWKPPQAATRARKTPLYVSPKGEAAVVAPCACKCACYPPSLRHRATHSPPCDADGEPYVAGGGYTHVRDSRLLCRAHYLPSPALTPRSTLKHSRAFIAFSVRAN